MVNHFTGFRGVFGSTFTYKSSRPDSIPVRGNNRRGLPAAHPPFLDGQWISAWRNLGKVHLPCGPGDKVLTHNKFTGKISIWAPRHFAAIMYAVTLKANKDKL